MGTERTTMRGNAASSWDTGVVARFIIFDCGVREWTGILGEPAGTAHPTMTAVRSRMPLGSGHAVEPGMEEPHDGVRREAYVDSCRAEATWIDALHRFPGDIQPS